MTYLIDTNIIIFALKDPQREVAKRLALTSPDQIALSAVVEAELYHGAEKYALSERRQMQLADFLSLYPRLPFDSQCVSHYANTRHHLEINGEVIGGNDLLIAATALAHGLTLITHNSSEFARVPGLLWEDWAVF
jgi:tRNA(fMet)-specific endonuclease VapC